MVRQATLAFVVAAIALACGCGQEAADTPQAPAIARIGGEPVAVEQIETLLAETKRSLELQGRPFPPEGSPYFLDLRDEGVRYLVERSAREQEAKRLGVEVHDDEIEREVAAIARESLRAETRRTGLSLERLRQDVRDRLVDRGIFKALVGRADETDNLAEARNRFKQLCRL